MHTCGGNGDTAVYTADLRPCAWLGFRKKKVLEHPLCVKRDCCNFIRKPTVLREPSSFPDLKQLKLEETHPETRGKARLLALKFLTIPSWTTEALTSRSLWDLPFPRVSCEKIQGIAFTS